MPLMRSAEFRRGREANWKKLDYLVTLIESKGIRSLTAEEARELPLLYRATVSSLSVARSIALDRNLLLYLEDLSLRGYLAVYGPRAGLWERLKGFFRRRFPQAVRGIRWHLAASTLVFMLGVLAGYLLVVRDMENYAMLMPAELAGGRGPASTPEELRKVIFDRWPGYVETFIVFANSLFRHNATIGILAFGLGFMLGLPTLFLLAYNGMMVGAIIALHVDKGLGLDFVGWLSIHGVTEILAILLCGAAGLVVAEKTVFPGRLSRLDSLARSGRLAAGVVAGAVVMFFIAGILEGGFRQLINNTPARFAFAAFSGAIWLLYFGRAGRAGGDGDDD